MPIPVFVSQVNLSANDLAGSEALGFVDFAPLPLTYYYFFVSNISAGQNGRSLLGGLAARFNTAMAATFTVTLTSDLLIQISHDSGSTKTPAVSTPLAIKLGFVVPTTTGASTHISIPSGTTYTAPYRSQFIWCPEMGISATGPELFDPAINYGVPSSVGSAMRSPDMTASFIANGTQYEASYLFNGVQPYYRAYPQTAAPFNRDLITWWNNGPRLGRRVLFWRDKASVVGSVTPSAGGASPFNYVVYQPNADLRAKPPLKATAPPMLVYWDVNLGFWSTEMGESVYS